MDNELMYVRFVRGSFDSYRALEVKDENTLYFIYDEVTGSSVIYLGSRIVSGSGEIRGASNLSELNDVYLSDLADFDILLYDLTNKQWNNIAFNDLISAVRDGLEQVNISVDENVFELTDSGALKLLGFDEAPPGSVPTKGEGGTIVWSTISMEAPELDTSELDTIKNTVTNVQKGLSALGEDIDAILTEMSELDTKINTVNEKVDKKANTSDVYTRTEVDTKVRDAIASVDHMKRKIVSFIDEIDLTAPDATQYIYMLPIPGATGTDRYDEYMIADGVLERVGAWDTDLSDYASKSELAGKVDKIDGYSLVADSDIDKLTGIQVGAQVNAINGVSSAEFEITDVAKILNLKAVPASKIVDLDSHTTITTLSGAISDLATKLNNDYITKTEFSTELIRLRESVTWTDI